MIVPYRDKDVERLSRGMRIPRYRAFERQALRKLRQLEIAGNLNDLRAYLREHLIAWIVAEEPWARPVQHIEPRATVTVEKDMSRERIARLAAELAGISGTNEAVAATV